MGKAMLAFLPQEQVDAIIDQTGLPGSTEYSITDHVQLQQELEESRERGYALDRGENEINTYCVAAPIFDASGRLCVSCSISGMDPEIVGRRLPELASYVMHSTLEASRRMDTFPSSQAMRLPHFPNKPEEDDMTNQTTCVVWYAHGYPFDSQGRVDFTAAGSLTDFLIERGINCLFVGGSTGEVIFLSAEERKKLSEFVIRHTAGRIPVIVQTGAETTQITVELTLHAKRSGATAASILVPYYFRYENEALLAYFETIAETVPDFPILLYIFPAFTGNDVSPALLKWLGDNVPNLVGMKVSNPDLIRFQDYLSVVDSASSPSLASTGSCCPL